MSILSWLFKKKPKPEKLDGRFCRFHQERKSDWCDECFEADLAWRTYCEGPYPPAAPAPSLHREEAK